ncbi:hypothetical protein NEMBOFW57_009514 [Staphylotrichum longicolle]|uniref:Rhodopsin domain-containing protein n=1 Tax=Staphylotrichum longicolle TaxID=669026 RepID=A0AAD4HTG5_9PEZI|nr:hypothetical protein NEMBOFW57_009514 [Staphylotrichum longicolle]
MAYLLSLFVYQQYPSVVFASAYRFSVLFSYNNNDPTYTLALTVGWTAIEMSAGIVSACLPILGPVMAFCAGKLGIKRSVLRIHGGGTTKTLSSKNFAQSATGSMKDRTEIELQKVMKGSAGRVFYLLPDDQMMDKSGRV